MKKIYVVGNDLAYSRFISDSILVNSLQEADIVMFTGGEDVDPSLYKAKKHPSTISNLQRDLQEMEEFNQISENQLVVGICRGLNWGSR